MNENTGSNPDRKIIVDDDWKEQVAREKEELQARQEEESSGTGDESAGESAENATPAPEASTGGSSAGSGEGGEIPKDLPPASFPLLVELLAAQASAALAQAHAQPDHLRLARHFIDLLGVVQEKTRNNLDGDEMVLLNNLLHELRMAYLQMQKLAGSPPATDSADERSS